MERRSPRQSPTRPLILFADAHEDTRELYAAALNPLGFDATTVRDGASAYALAWQVQPDVIVTELQLPELDGWELILDIRRNPRTCDVPVVVLTSEDQPASRARALRDGCAAFLVKPCPPADLATELRDILYKQMPARRDYDELTVEPA